LNILHVNQDIGTAGGGVASFIRDSACAMTACGDQVFSATAEESPAVTASFAGHHYLPQINDISNSDSSWQTTIENILEKNAIDVAHVHEVRNQAVTEYIAERIPTAIHLHNYNIICPGNDLFYNSDESICEFSVGAKCISCAYTKRCNNRHPGRLLRSIRNTKRKQTLKNFANVQFVAGSEHIRDRVVAAGIPASKVTVVLYAADPERLEAANTQPIPAAGDDFILYSGRLSRSKGVGYLLDAIAKISLGDTKLVIAGDGIYGEQIKKQIASLGLQDQVHLLGWRNGAELTWLYRNCRMLVVPSVWPEVFGIVGLEAMAAEKPVVACAVGGIPEWLEDGVTGYLVPPRDADAMAKRIETLLTDHGRASLLGAAGREAFVERFTTERQAETLANLYRSLCPSLPPSQKELECTSSI